MNFFEKSIRTLITNGGYLRIIGSEDFLLTEHQALRRLRELGVVTKILRNPTGNFHPKLYLFKCGSKFHGIVGSPNLSEGAFSTNVEAAIYFSGYEEDAVVNQTYEFFRSLWESETSWLVDDAYLNSYMQLEMRFRGDLTRITEEVRAQLGAHFSAPRRSRPTIREMCRAVMVPGEKVHYMEVTRRVIKAFPEWEYGKTPQASVRRDLNFHSQRHPERQPQLFVAEEPDGYYSIPG